MYRGLFSVAVRCIKLLTPVTELEALNLSPPDLLTLGMPKMTKLVPTYTPKMNDDDASTTSTLAHTLPQTMTSSSEGATVELHPLPDKEGLIIKVQPPQAPKDVKLVHVSCDIVLVIDVSGSMETEATLPDGSEEETSGLSVLDLVKHACRTILSTLNEHDRLAIITYSADATVIQELTAMTLTNKKTAEDNINKMRVSGMTNLWAGLKQGLKTLKSEKNTGRVPAVLVLTDGMPNYMCPPEGYVPALRALGDIIPTIHTFGFGYELSSGLLKSIAEHGRGNYAFICDAGMIGTVFVHAVAHLQSTFATNGTLRLRYPGQVTLEQTAGSSVDRREPEIFGRDNHLVVSLGNIQYGQSRDIYLRWKSVGGEDEKQMEDLNVEATLEYGLATDSQKYTSKQSRSLTAYTTDLTPAEVAYHISRHQILEFISSIFPIDPLGEHRTHIPLTHRSKAQHRYFNHTAGDPSTTEHAESVRDPLLQAQAALRALIATIPAASHPTDPRCTSLMQDLAGPPPHGQITIALSQQFHFAAWGQHYLPSLHGAHARQLCNTFRDPGPLQYGAHSPLFLACRNALSAAFDDLPPPAPSLLLPAPTFLLPAAGAQRPRTDASGRSWRSTKSMSLWNDVSNPCFAAQTMVVLAGEAGARERIDRLEKGARVRTPAGPRAVAAVLVTPVRELELVKFNGVLVTPWHPVLLEADGRGEWVFPCRTSLERVRYTGSIYSIMLREDGDVDSHAIMLGNGQGQQENAPFWGVTLGHGMLEGSDARAHPFFGSYELVASSLKVCSHDGKGRYLAGGTKRNTETGLVCGFNVYSGAGGPDKVGRSLALAKLRRMRELRRDEFLQRLKGQKL